MARVRHLTSTMTLTVLALSSALLAITFALSMALAAEPGPPAGSAEPVAEAVMPEMAELDFGKMLVMQRCANCHGLAEGEDRYAAPLHNLFGRMPGSIPGYTFSINMKKIGIAWSPSILDNWLEQTTFDTPDIRMRHVGITNKTQRAAVIAYLKSLPGNADKEDK